MKNSYIKLGQPKLFCPVKSKKRRLRTLLGKGRMAVGMITVVGSMMMSAQSDAQSADLQFAPQGNPDTWENGGAQTDWDVAPYDGTGDVNWDNTANGGIGDNAIFVGNDGGVITIGGTVNANRVATTVGAGGYSFSGGTLLLGGASQISAGAGSPITIGSVIDGTSGLNIFGDVTLTSANTFTGVTTVNDASVLELDAAGALDPDSQLNLLGTALLDVDALTVVDNLEGAVGSTIDISASLEVNPEAGETSTMAGVISGAGAGGATPTLLKSGDGTWVLSGNNTYTNDTFITDGVLEIQNNMALGASGFNDETEVFDGATLRLNGVLGALTVGEEIYATGLGHNGGGAILNASGANALNGPIYIEGVTSIQNDDTTNALTIGGDIDSTGANGSFPTITPRILRIGGPGDIDVNGEIDNGGGNRIDDVVKYGTGTVDLRGSDHDYDEDTIIEEGTLLVDNVNNLGDFNTPDIIFRDLGAANDYDNTVLRYTAAGTLDLDNTGTSIHFDGAVNPTVGTIFVENAAGVVSTEYDQYTSNNANNVLRLAGPGTLNIEVDAGDLTAAPALSPLSNSICEIALGAPAVVDPFAPGSGLIVDPSAGELIFDNSGFGRSRAVLTLNGLGSTDPVNFPSAGELTLVNLNLVIADPDVATFGGTINTDGAVGIVNGASSIWTGPQNISGQIVIGKDSTLTIGDYGSLGTNGDYATNGTYVCGDGTLALNALTGTAPLNERITLFNNANLVNNEGDNVIASEIFLQHDPLDNPGPGGTHTARIGALDGTLTLTGGIDAHDTPGDMNLGLNTGATDAGVIFVNSEIEATVVDLDIGNSSQALDGSVGVALMANNSYTGETRLQGGTIQAGDSSAFSSGQIIVVNNVTLGGTSVTIGNDIQINAGANLNIASGSITPDTFGISGVISGNGTLTVGSNFPASLDVTLSGENTYSGSTTVTNGILNLNGTLASSAISVGVDGTLNTNGTERLDNATTVDVDGTWNLGGDETIAILDGDLGAVVDMSNFSLTTSSGNFFGNVTNSHGQYNKVGGGIQIFGGNFTANGGTHVVNGTLNLGSNAGSQTITTSFIDVDAAGSVVLNDANSLQGNTDLNIAGNLTLAGAETVGTGDFILTGSLAGTGTLTSSTTGYTLNDGASTAAGADLGDGEIRANGNVSLAGNTGTGPLQVQTGTTTATGSIGGDVNVLTAANLVLNGSDIADGADVNNQGTITITGSDTIDNYVSSNGTLVANGAANLTATGEFLLLDGSTVAADITGDAISSGNVQLANTITGNLLVQAGGTTSQFGNVSGNVGVANGATLDSDGNIGGTLNNAGTAATSGQVDSVVNSGTLNHDGDIITALTNSGTVTLAVDDSISGAYTSNGGTLNGGGQTLTAASYALNDGSVVNANLGTGTGTANGAVALNGNAAGDLSVASGTTTQGAASTVGGNVTVVALATLHQNGAVTGNLTNSGLTNLDGAVGGDLINNVGGTVHVTGTVQGTTDNDGTLTNVGMTLIGDVDNSGTMTNATNGIADTANLTNSGTFTQVGADTVLSYTQDGAGTFNGGSLTAATNTLNGGTVNGDLAGAAVNVNGAVALNGELTNGSVAVDINNGGNLTTGSDERINNGGSVNVDLGGTLTLGGHETIQTLTGAGSVVNGNSLIIDDNGTNGTFAGVISGAGDLVKEGNGTLTLNGINTFTGDTNVNDGTLTLGGALASTQVNVAQGAILNLDGGHLAANSVLTADGRVNVLTTSNVWDILGASSGRIDIAGGAVLNLHGIDFDGTITGAGGIDLQSGNINLDGNSTFTGNTIISGGTAFLNGSLDSSIVNVTAGGSLVLGNNHGDHLDNASTLSVGGTVDVSSTERVATLTVTGGTVDGGGTINATTYNLNGATVHANLGMGTLNQTGADSTLNGNSAASPVNVNSGTLTLNGELTSGILNLTIANGATLATGGAERINNNATVTVNGDLDLAGDETIRTLMGAATGDVMTNGNAFTVTGGNYAGDISGGGSLNVNGGSLSLTNAVAYTGDTNVNSGTLSVAGINGSLNVNVANGATLTTTGNDQLADNGTLNANGTVNLGGSETINILNGGVTGLVNNGSGLTLNSGSFGGSITGTGALNKNSNGTLALTGDNSTTGTANINDGSVELSGTLASATVNVGNTAELNLNGSERLANNSNVNVNAGGTLNLGGAETAGNLDVTNASVGGTGTLTAATYDLTDATTGSTANLGTGILNSDGVTTLGGNSAADTVNVDSGSLTLNGELTNGNLVVNIDTGTTLNTGADERINDGGTVNAEGTLNLGGHETITTLNGAGTVDLNTYSLTVGDGLFTGTMTNDHGDLNVVAGAPGGLVFDGATGTFTGAVHVEGGGLFTIQNGTTLASTEVEIDGFGTMNITDSEVGSVGNPVNVNINVDGTLNLSNAVLADGSNLNVDGTLNVNSSSQVWDVTGGNTGLINLNGAGVVLNLNGIDFDGVVSGAGSINAASGTIDLGGNSDFTGDLTVQSGSTVELDGTVTGATNVNVNNGGTLVLGSSERINDDAVLNANGLLTLNGIETVAQVNASGTINGNGTLRLQDVNTGTFELNQGAVVDSGANLGDGTLNVNAGAGTVELNGNKAGGDDSLADTTNVNSGILNLHGSITDPDGLAVNVLAGATLQLHHDEAIGDNAVLTSNGRVNLHGTENVTTFNLNGPGSVLGLTAGAPDPSLLVADTYNLGNGATTETGANMGDGILNIVNIAPNGVVTLNGESAAEVVNIAAGTTLQLGASERLNSLDGAGAENAVVNNLGTMNLNGVETICIYNSDSGDLGGVGTLNAKEYNLDGNSSVGAGVNLGGGVVNVGCNTVGTVTLDGNSAAEDFTICVGSTLNLNGMLTGIGTNVPNPLDFDGQLNGNNLTIEDAATLNLGSAERINDDAVVVNAGSVNLNGLETVGTFISSGTLGGSGTLATQGNTITLINGHTSLIGTTLLGLGSSPQLTSNGTVNINGTANDNSLANNANLDVSTAQIQSGTMFLNGQFINTVNGAPDIRIFDTATLVNGSGERVADTATMNVDNGGTWTLNGTDTIADFNSGGLLNGSGRVEAPTYNLTDGAVTTVNAALGNGTLTSDGTVNLFGIFDGEIAQVNSGQLNLGSAGRFSDSTVDVFVDDDAILNLGGNENVDFIEIEGVLRDNGGAASLLTANDYLLDSGTTLAGANLGTGDLDSVGTSTLNGNTNADTIDINAGSLATNGSVQNANGVITVDGAAGGNTATWFVNGAYDYARLQGHGFVNPGGINGNTFVNNGIVGPGSSVGTLTILGDYVENGTLETEFQPGASDFSNHDRLIVNGNVTLNGGSVLDLQSINGFDANGIECGERFNVISSFQTGQNDGLAINGAWSSIGGSNALGSQTFGNQVLFDLGTGDVVGTGLAAGQNNSNIPGISAAQLQLFDAVTGSAIDTVGNYNSDDNVSGTVLDRILREADAGGIAGKLNALDRLSPEGYAGAADYALHATRGYMETVMQTTPFGGTSVEVPQSDPKGGLPKGGLATTSIETSHQWQTFGGYHNLSLGSDSSSSGNDYDLDSQGGYAGFRGRSGDKLTYGGFIGVDDGDVRSGGLNLDTDGFVVGAFAQYQASDRFSIWGNAAYGSYEFQGHRNTLGDRLDVDAFDANAFHLGVGVDYLAYERNGLSLTPGMGLRFIDSSTDDITETGGPTAMNIDGVDAESLLFDIKLKAAYRPDGKRYGFHGHVGWQNDFEDSDRNVTASFASGGGAFSAMAPGVGDSAVTFGIGGYYDITEDFRFGVSYRGEARNDGDDLNAFDLRFTYQF